MEGQLEPRSHSPGLCSESQHEMAKGHLAFHVKASAIQILHLKLSDITFLSTSTLKHHHYCRKHWELL